MTRRDRTGALLCYGAAMAMLCLGIAAAAVRFPGGFDWMYTVASRLGSPSHNPDGARWLTGSLLASAALLWPVADHLGRSFARAEPGPRSPAVVPRIAGLVPRFAVIALRVGLLGAGLLALEGMLGLELSSLVRKGHELAALATFLGLYGGVLGLLIHRARQPTRHHPPQRARQRARRREHVEAAGSYRERGAAAWPALLVVLPLLAIGASQLALYLGQRDLGWVNVGWRELGVPFWLSFAFWQWLAVALLAVGLGLLVLDRGRPRPAPAAS